MPLMMDGSQATLTGHCIIEEAEDLLSWCLDHPQGTVDLSGLTHMHTAILQVLMALHPTISAMPQDLAQWGWLRALSERGEGSDLNGLIGT